MRRVITFAYRNEVVGTSRGGYRNKEVVLYRVGRYDIAEVARETYNFKDDGQAARELAESRGLFNAGERTQSGSMRIEYRDGFTYCGNARFKQL